MSERITIIVMLVAAAIITLTLSIVAWRRKNPGRAAIFLALCMAGVAIYSFGYAMELASETLKSAMFWVRFQHWGIQIIAPTWLLFSLAVSGNEKRITRKFLIFLFIIPLYLFLISQTLGWLNLAHHNPRLITEGAFPVFSYDRNQFNLIAVGFYSFCLAVSTILFAIMLLRAAPSFRRQAVIYLLGSLPPWLGLILHNLNLSNNNLDYTPMALGLGGLIFSYGFLKYRILDIIPMARDAIFENMQSGVLILDIENRIIDFNPSLQAVFPQINASSISLAVNDLFSDFPILLGFLKDSTENKMAFEINNGQNISYYQVNVSTMFDRQRHPIGRVVSFYENTQQRKLMNELEKLASLDGLTGVYNRQYFNQLAEREINRVERYGGDLSMIMVDLDNFKLVNDTYGHMAGDQALIGLVEVFQNTLRQTDVLARFGGDEFIVLLPETASIAASVSAERLRQALNAHRINYEGKEIKIIASFGVTGFSTDTDKTLEAMYRSVDRAVYCAKDAGGNTVFVDKPEAAG